MNAVIDAIRQQLERSDRASTELPVIPVRSGPSSDPVDQFIDRATSLGVQCVSVESVTAARETLWELCATRSLRKIAASDGALAKQLVTPGVLGAAVVKTVDDRNDLFDVDLGVTEAQWAVAETGTLVLTSSAERHRLTSLVPAIHFAVLPASRIVATMPTVFDHVIASGTKHQAITFITGPSRTADIELTLVVGVHGPKELVVTIVRDL